MALATNQVSAWNMDESSGNAADAIGSNTLTNVSYTFAAGKINNGAVGNGSATLLSPSTALGIGSGFTLAAWVKTSSSTTQGVIMKDDVASARDFQFKIETTGVVTLVRFDSGNSVVANFSTAVTVNDGNWHLLVAKFDTTNGSVIYIDDVSRATNATTTANHNSTSIFGVGSGTATFLTGTIDIVGIWSVAKSTTDMSTYYNSGNATQYPYTSGPTNLKSLDTNTKSNMKSLDTNVLNNIKSIDTNV